MYQEDGPHIPPPPNPLKDPGGFLGWLVMLAVVLFIILLAKGCLEQYLT